MTSDFDPIRDIEARAERAGVAIPKLLKAAGVAASTFSRWKSGQTTPTLRIYRKLLAALPPTTLPQSTEPGEAA